MFKLAKQSQWEIRKSEVIRTNYDHIWIVTRLFAFDDWKEIWKILETYFGTSIIINPLYDENSLISIGWALIEDFITEVERWQAMGSFHLKFSSKSGINLSVADLW